MNRHLGPCLLDVADRRPAPAVRLDQRIAVAGSGTGQSGLGTDGFRGGSMTWAGAAHLLAHISQRVRQRNTIAQLSEPKVESSPS